MVRLFILLLCLLASGAWAGHKILVHLPDPISTEPAAQVLEIVAAQKACLRLLEGTSYTIHRSYEMLPFLALEVDDEGMQLLQDATKILSVAPDIKFSPTHFQLQ